MEKFTKSTRSITRLLEGFCFAAMLGLTIIVALQVISRMVKVSLPWTEELARFLIVWLTFLGCSLAIYRKGHLAVNFLVDMMPPSLKKAVGIFTRLIMLAFFTLVLVYGVKLSSTSMKNLSTSLHWPMGAVYAVLPFSALLSDYYILLDILNLAGLNVLTWEKEAAGK